MICWITFKIVNIYLKSTKILVKIFFRYLKYRLYYIDSHFAIQEPFIEPIHGKYFIFETYIYL